MPSLSHRDDYFETPDWLFNDIEKETGLRFQLDACANESNTKCVDFLDEIADTLQCTLAIDPIFCNPPRSKNGKFVTKMYDTWQEENVDIVMLLCWNDLGNKYGEKLLPHILNGEIRVENLGKIKFCKGGKESEFVSRLTYFWAHFKKK